MHCKTPQIRQIVGSSIGEAVDIGLFDMGGN